ncbi:Aste57867_20458 [Aphanomyces stellatus]|uniref:Aste57867_20458 protein n=1 Tax=Aphanomyces stellatus TaxID=120398 RepID=A0A485LH18_9STRA|nr:hypothetical protein As57867_020392 [Aphanomyces stellatus]VFT97144.1 Aste57867_20458 [Aphanomyces stellatus]
MIDRSHQKLVGMPPIDLRCAHAPTTPADVLTQLSQNAVSLGISSFDVYGDFSSNLSWLQTFQAEVAARLGKQRALFVPSGVMAQSIALKIHAETTARRAFVARYNSHLFLHEQDSFRHLLHLDAEVVPPTNARFQPSLQYDDVEPLLAKETAGTVVLELPEREVGGKLMPFAELCRVAEAAKAHGVRVHMDGARLWEAEAAYLAAGQSLHEVTALFDSIYVSFYKGLGAITGAMLVGDNAFIDAAQVWLRRFGGNVYTQLPYAVSCWAGFRRHPAAEFTARRQRLQEVVRALTDAAIVGLTFDPPIPDVSLVHVHVQATVEQATAARDAAEAATGIRVFAAVRPYAPTRGCYFELNVGAFNVDIPIETWVRGWQAFADATSSTGC